MEGWDEQLLAACKKDDLVCLLLFSLTPLDHPILAARCMVHPLICLSHFVQHLDSAAVAWHFQLLGNADQRGPHPTRLNMTRLFLKKFPNWAKLDWLSANQSKFLFLALVQYVYFRYWAVPPESPGRQLMTWFTVVANNKKNIIKSHWDHFISFSALLVTQIL